MMIILDSFPWEKAFKWGLKTCCFEYFDKWDPVVYSKRSEAVCSQSPWGIFASIARTMEQMHGEAVYSVNVINSPRKNNNNQHQADKIPGIIVILSTKLTRY
jgi:hypothetical protein